MLGIVIPWVVVQLEQRSFFSISSLYKQLDLFAVGLIVLSVARLTHTNEYLAAFTAGIVIATIAPDMRASFYEFGETIAELLKLAALLVFGSIISLPFLSAIPWNGYIFALLLLVLARPLSLAFALFGTELSRHEWIAAAWFGPKGFASVVYGLLIWQSGVPHASHLFHLIALVIIASIIAHSSTDVAIARWFTEGEPAPVRE